MSDPLSVAGSVAGLISLAASLGSTLYQFQQCTSDAPESARRCKQELDSMRDVFRNIELFILTGSASAMHIQLNDFLRVITDCVLTFSGFETLMDELTAGTPGILSRAKWALKENEILKFVERMGRLQGTLSLMLSTLQM